jgi:homoserine dehydrogenase
MGIQAYAEVAAMIASDSIRVGLIGLGVIGSGVAKVMLSRPLVTIGELKTRIELSRIAEANPAKTAPPGFTPERFSNRADDVLNDPSIQVVIELIGGEHPALEIISRALTAGKHVVTANKEVISKHGNELTRLALEHKASLRYEASVGGGIPLIAPFQRDLVVNDIQAIHAIVNGTTNYIVTKMGDENLDFSVALKQAQKLGYAEANPANDIEGNDTAYKIAILSSLGFRSEVTPQDVYREGIFKLKARDFRYARELGYAIKLLAIAKRNGQGIQVRVHPVFIPEDSLLAKVKGVFNAIQVEGDLLGKVIFYGRGAGPEPTSSAVLADVVNISTDIALGRSLSPSPYPKRQLTITPMEELTIRYYLRVSVADRPGVLAQISRILGEHAISISSVIQKEADPADKSAEIVITTHPSLERAMRLAMTEVASLPVVKEIGNLVRIEDLID